MGVKNGYPPDLLSEGMKRMDKENESRLKKKADFYYKEKITCHIIKEPKGFINGLFLSKLINDTYYLFQDIRYKEVTSRLFLCDIFDIKDYTEKKW